MLSVGVEDMDGNQSSDSDEIVPEDEDDADAQDDEHGEMVRKLRRRVLVFSYYLLPVLL
jgi:hypothetical protein